MLLFRRYSWSCSDRLHRRRDTRGDGASEEEIIRLAHAPETIEYSPYSYKVYMYGILYFVLNVSKSPLLY